MTSAIEAVVAQTDPVTAALLIVIWREIRHVEAGLQDELNRLRGRVSKVETRSTDEEGEHA